MKYNDKIADVVAGLCVIHLLYTHCYTSYSFHLYMSRYKATAYNL